MINLDRWLRLGRWFMAVWFVFTLPSAVQILQTGHSAGDIALAAGILTWGAVWIWFWLRAAGRNRTAEIFGLAISVVLLGLFALFTPAPIDVGGVMVFAFILAGACFPVREAIKIMIGLVVLQIGLEVLRLDPVSLAASGLVNSILVGVVGIGARLFWQSYKQLVAAREQLANLAVTEERLRFARDLHDLLGQSLAVLVLKSELVAKQLPENSDDTLRAEVRDIALVARKSLNDVREAVAGYRRPTLQAEISSARSALRAAGIGLLVEDKVGDLPPEQDGVLAWCLREAVTNVVKHSGAQRCEVRIFRDDGLTRLDVSDDGHGAALLNGGSGLAGMRERVELVGGTMKVESDAGLHVRVSVPQPA
ncbi:MAG TPA: sensor histidine kinase [Candidatus Dormibacteraeota bacterium]|nr:sensor histidine kinase [Candidatus Dormibacteraeota bacterium]